MSKAPELFATLLDAEEAKAMLLNDVSALVARRENLPLARAIVDALVAMDKAIDAHKPD